MKNLQKKFFALGLIICIIVTLTFTSFAGTTEVNVNDTDSIKDLLKSYFDARYSMMSKLLMSNELLKS